jgi:hypothetical protein
MPTDEEVHTAKPPPAKAERPIDLHGVLHQSHRPIGVAEPVLAAGSEVEPGFSPGSS